MKRLILHPAAKVNLYLKVGGRLNDGHHPLLTLFERLDLADTLTLTRKPAGIHLACDDPGIPTDGRNLVVRAAQKFFASLSGGPSAAGVDIDLVKKIPVAGGLGGGSSDAASALAGLNMLYDRPFKLVQLMEMGRFIGADVPFFVSGAVLAWGRGRGDEIDPISPPPKPFWHVLANPGIPMLTKEVYGAYDQVCPSGSDLTECCGDVTLITRLVQGGDPDFLSGSLANSLEIAIDANYPAIREVKSSLSEAGCLGVLVSGSGSTAYGLVRGEAQAREIQQRLKRSHPSWTVVAARTALALS
ncbi:MAG: 4-(cytidine 5'-diphospho)-2-C-methyl-D-erythritol kinase [Candidatus Omnitrophica bacterium]|nr:4-(cytidine 5'-diphospho)-2-C-methyl-D-erythritol kinase [Candidatus Omnitrophota bacterium]